MDPGDAIALGFADSYVPSDRLDTLRAALAAGTDPQVAVAEVAEPAPRSQVLEARSWWDPIAMLALSGDDDQEPGNELDRVIRLVRALENDPSAEAQATAEVVRAMCPTSVAITLAQIARTRAEQLSLADVLRDDLRVVVRLAHRPDFAEGVRAQVIDKDRSPCWNPARIEDLDPEEIVRLLAPLQDDEYALAI